MEALSQLNQRSNAIRESLWLRIGTLQTAYNDRDRALEAFERVLRVNPSNIHAMTQVGAVLAKKERYDRAVGFLQRAIAADSTCGEAWAVLAHCYVMTDDLPKAYQAYQNALNHLQDPSDPNLWYGIGLLYDRYGSLDNALEAFLAVLRISPNFERAIEVCFCIGIIYKEQRKLDEAMSYFNKVSLAPNPPPPLTRADGWYQIGHVNELKRDITKALEMYKLALRENPSHAKTLQNLGWLEHSHKENSREAIRLLQLSLEADQNDGQTWYLLGRVFMALREFRQAYDAYQQAVYRDGRNATFWCSIGVLYYQMNQYRDAMDAYARAIRLNPSVSEVWYDLGTLYESCGQTNDAIDAYRRAADLAPESTQITERLNVLQNSQHQGNANHAPQQSQPMSSQPALQQPHPQLPPPNAHLSSRHQSATAAFGGGGAGQQQQQQDGGQGQNTLPPPPGQQQHAQTMGMGNHQLQPILRAPPGMQQQQQQQPIPMLTQPAVAPSSSAHQALPRHIMQHPLQQPPGASAASTTHPNSQQPHSMQPPNHVRPGSLPHLTLPSQAPPPPNTTNNNTAVGGGGVGAQGPSQGATQRSDGDRTSLPPPGPQVSHHLPVPPHNQGQLQQPPLPLSHSLPQLPALQRDGNSQQGPNKPDEAAARDGPPGQPALPHLRIVGKEGAPNQLEQIVSLQRNDGPPPPPPAYGGQTSRPPSSIGSIPPIPSLAPLGPPPKQSNDPVVPNPPPHRLPPPGVVSDPATKSSSSALAPLQNNTSINNNNTPDHHQQKHNSDHASTLPPVNSTPMDTRSQASSDHQSKAPHDPTSNDATMRDVVASNDSRPQPNGSMRSAQGNGNGHKDAELLHSIGTQNDESKRTPLPPVSSVGPPASSASPSVPALPIPRSAPAPRLGKEGGGDMRLGGLGGSSLSKFGRSQPNQMSSSKLPATLPSPLAPPRKLASPLNGTGAGTVNLAPPVKPGAGNSGDTALPSPSSLPSLPAIKSQPNENSMGSMEQIPPMKHDDKEKTNGVESGGGGGGSAGPKLPSIPRSVPISSLSEPKEQRDAVNSGIGGGGGGSVHGSTNSSKREASPSMTDNDKTYKRPRVNEERRAENGNTAANEAHTEKNDMEEKDKMRHGNEPVPSLRAYREQRVQRDGRVKSPIAPLRAPAPPFQLRSVPQPLPGITIPKSQPARARTLKDEDKNKEKSAADNPA